MNKADLRRIWLSTVASAATGVAIAVSGGIYSSPAWALSELQQTAPDEEQQADDAQTGDETPVVEKGLPLPEPLISEKQPTSATADFDHNNGELPDAVARMRTLIIEAAAAGDLDRVATLMNPGPDQTDIGPDDSGNDLAVALRNMSGDVDGMEILAIMLDVLSTAHAVVDANTPNETYVWPYFAERPINDLTPPEKVDLMRIVTAGDYADMLEYGGYNFYRIGITAEGRWKFFLAGN